MGVSRALVKAFPSVSLIRVKDVVGQLATIFDQMALAIRAAASVALASGIAVLIGAIAASRRARLYDAVLLKMLGATRGQILAAQGIEYALLAVVIATLALAAGVAVGWYIVVHIFEFRWTPDWAAILATLGVGTVATLGIGLLGSLALLNARPARALRQL